MTVPAGDEPRISLRRLGRPLAQRVRGIRRRYELREAVDTIRGVKGVSLVLVYHRIATRGSARYEVVPTIPRDLFREQLSAFGEIGHIVPLHSLMDDPGGGRGLRLALTFDDDYTTHVLSVLPLLRELGLHGTFFLSGRALHGLGGYWFQRLEALLAEKGLDATASLLDLSGVIEPQLPLRCEGDPRRLTLIDRHAPLGDAPLDAHGINELAKATMTVGFHTLHHPVLPLLDDDGLRDALTAGRDRLATFVGRPVNWLAYPHGRTDLRTIGITRELGYTAAWTTQPRTVRPNDDPYQLGRWEPQPIRTDDVLIGLGRLLQRMNERRS
jgi:peptidoglycan/xylan/chitin deacetylase (PgdA/CDA1 family)